MNILADYCENGTLEDYMQNIENLGAEIDEDVC